MQPDRVSRTAEFMALFRAAEDRKGAADRLFADPMAIGLLPPALAMAARLSGVPGAGRLIERGIDRRWPGARSSAVARTWLIDQWITAAAASIDQVVILGAGLDTRAWRLPALSGKRICEVDHPATGAAKRRRLEVAGADLSRVTFVSVDFDRHSLAGALEAAGFDQRLPALVLWEGVSQYLAADNVDAVVRWAGAAAPGSRLILTYVHRGAIDGSVAFIGAGAAIAKVNQSSEPWRFGLLPEELPNYLQARGLRLIDDQSADEYRPRAFGDRAAAMTGYGFYHVALAETARA